MGGILRDEIFKEDGLLTKLRCDDRFDNDDYQNVKKALLNTVSEWKWTGKVDVDDFVAIVDLIQNLAGGSRFWNEEVSMAVEDAELEIVDIIHNIYNIIGIYEVGYDEWKNRIAELIPKDQFIYEKQMIRNALMDTTLLEITYTDDFHLLFFKDATAEKWMLTISTSFWVGKRKDWEELNTNENGIVEMEDRLAASKLVNMKYWNQVGVEGVEFSEKYMHILMEGEYILSIAYDYRINTEFSFALEEFDWYSNKEWKDKQVVYCDGKNLTAKNFPTMT